MRKIGSSNVAEACVEIARLHKQVERTEFQNQGAHTNYSGHVFILISLR